jgi:CubicO group peptidase (beta-lactamase class C family)
MKAFIYVLLTTLALSACKSNSLLTNNKTIDGIMNRYSNENEPGASVLVFKQDKIVFKKGYGIKQISTGEKITSTTNFRLASITKQFTAMAILQLAQQKKLSLEDPITKYFASFPDYGKKIKIKHLLTHTSGLQDYEDLMPASQNIQLHDTNCLQFMYLTNRLYFPAGTQYRYSNTGYAILALLVEKLSGLDYATYLKENIFKPLGMKTTVAYEAGKSSITNRAFGHSMQNGNWIETDQSLTSAVLGDGGIYSNTEELSKWISALWNYKLLNPLLQNQAWTGARLDNGKAIDYGFGWHMETFKNRLHPFHDGSSIGFRNSILVFPEEKLMVVILTNRNEHDPIEEAKKIADMFLP